MKLTSHCSIDLFCLFFGLGTLQWIDVYKYVLFIGIFVVLLLVVLMPRLIPHYLYTIYNTMIDYLSIFTNFASIFSKSYNIYNNRLKSSQ